MEGDKGDIEGRDELSPKRKVMRKGEEETDTYSGDV